MNISIPRAGITSVPFDNFARDNAAFMPEGELDRLFTALSKDGKATHTASTAGQFAIEVVKPAA